MRVALVSPVPYPVGMSNLAIHLVYAAFNQIPGVACHRFFANESALLSRITPSSIKIRSVETGEPLSAYSVIAFSLNYENELPNISRILHGAGIPVLSAARTSRDPLVIAGGVIATINPEAVAPLFDACILGEAEELIPELAELLGTIWTSGRDRKETLEAIGSVPGVYVPEWYRPIYGKSGHFVMLQSTKSGSTGQLFRRYIPDLNLIPGSMVIHTSVSEFKEMHLLEISRGCPRSCRFCLIPGCYGPFRYRSAESVMKEAGYAPPGWRIGLLGAGGADHPELLEICRRLAAKQFKFTFSSLHTSGITEDFSNAIQSSGIKSLTLAPEVGLDDRRFRIGKKFSNIEILDSVFRLAKPPIHIIKVYFMIGLPGETVRDLDAIGHLCLQIQQTIRESNRDNKTIPRLNVGISCFVPKAMSPFERAPMECEKNLKKRLKHVTSHLKTIREIRYSHDTPKWAIVQGMIARGDRRIAEYIALSGIPGVDWYKTFMDLPDSVTQRIHQRIPLSERLPWDHLKTPLYCDAMVNRDWKDQVP